MPTQITHVIITPKHSNVHDAVTVSVLARDEQGEAQVVRISRTDSPLYYVDLYYEAISEFLQALTIMKEEQVLTDKE